jgi:hypothetical protein
MNHYRHVSNAGAILLNYATVMKHEGFFQGDKQMTGFAKSIGATMIAAAALLFFAAPVAAERIVPATAAPGFHLAQAETGNPCGGMGGMGGMGGKSGGMCGDKGGGMKGGSAANPCGGMGGKSGKSGKSGGMCGDKGGNTANPCGGMGGKGCAMMCGMKSGMKGGMGGGAANPCGGMGANKKNDYKKDPYKNYKPGTVAARLDKKLTRLETAIKPRKDQKAAFKAFTDTIRKRVKPTEEILIALSNRWKQKDAPGAIERLSLREKKAAIHHTNISVTRRALEQLYKVLGKDQKKRVDTLFAKRRFHHLP